MRDSEYIDIPLVFEKLEAARSTRSGRVSGNDILDYCCGIGESHNRASAEGRYYDLVSVDGSVFFFPRHERFLATFANPLKFAKVNYVLGNYQGTIALAGFVGEMCAVFIYDLALWHSRRQSGRQLGISIQAFERKRQTSRVETLTSLGLINEAYAESFVTLNSVRNAHIHGYRISPERLRSDAKEAYGLAVRILLAAIGQRREGSLFGGWRKGASVSVEPCHPLVLEFLNAKWKSRSTF